MNTMLRALAFVVLGIMLAVGPVSAAAVKVSVNGEAITDFQIAQRVKLLTLEGRASSKTATSELIDEALMLQDAKRLGITVSDAQVEDALLNVARNIRVSRDKLEEILQANGVGIDTLKARLRAGIAWQSVIARMVEPKVQLSDAELDKEALQKLESWNSYDYVLKEVIFLLPGGKGSASKRTAEANQYRKSFSGCDNAVKLSLSYTDAAVVNVGRRHATQMQEPIAKELAGLNVGGITRPRVVENGVSMLAVCSKEEAKDTTFVKGQIRQAQGTEQLKAQADKYLADLRAKADIRNN
jgi:peptidyl-prolyl cis-trans isomerase SurA